MFRGRRLTQRTERWVWPIVIGVVFTSGALLIPPPVIVGTGNWGGHALSYACVACVLVIRRVYPLVWIIGGLMALGSALELIQPHVGRVGSLSDVVANGAGIVIGCSLGIVMQRLRN